MDTNQVIEHSEEAVERKESYDIAGGQRLHQIFAGRPSIGKLSMNIERGIIGRDLGGKNRLECLNTVLNRATPQ